MLLPNDWALSYGADNFQYTQNEMSAFSAMALRATSSIYQLLIKH